MSTVPLLTPDPPTSKFQPVSLENSKTQLPALVLAETVKERRKAIDNIQPATDVGMAAEQVCEFSCLRLHYRDYNQTTSLWQTVENENNGIVCYLVLKTSSVQNISHISSLTNHIPVPVNVLVRPKPKTNVLFYCYYYYY